jgi:phosphohistidine phosphatase
MKLFLVRHTEAIDYETESVRTDDIRFITPKGRKISTTVFKALKDDFADLDKIFTSPLVRAVQTAEILAVIEGFTTSKKKYNL